MDLDVLNLQWNVLGINYTFGWNDSLRRWCSQRSLTNVIDITSTKVDMP